MHAGETPFPHVYEAALDWPGVGPAVSTAGPRPALLTGPPPEFGGEEEWWSPEHLLLSAVNLCLMATFGALSRARGLRVQWYRSRARGVLSKTPGGLAFTSLGVTVEMRAAPGDVERARETLLKAKQRCIVANALVLPVQLDVEIEAVEAPEPVGVG
jgi:organic hydroperoxide reductase OsmC/OhrA